MGNQTFNIEGVGKVTVTDKHYVGQGGEAMVYAKDQLAIKIYTDVNRMIPIQKIKELNKIKSPYVLTPKHIVYKGGSTPVGYATSFKANNHPLCKLFTKAFKSRNNISDQTINNLIRQMQSTVFDVHQADCLCVDLNEMNEIVSPKFANVYFIDVDSYQTPSFKATAIMESIRDRKIVNQKWNEDSDWFSFAVLAFQMWIGIHPYKGKHPDFKNSEWSKRMDQGVSVFDPDVVLPRVCNDLSVIPKSHLGWFKSVFEANERCAPPEMGDFLTVSMPKTFKFVSASKDFEVDMVERCEEIIKDIFSFVGVNYFIGEQNIHKGRATLPISISGADRVFMSESAGVDPIVCILDKGVLTFSSINGKTFGQVPSNGVMKRNGCVYSINDNRLMEIEFQKMGNSLIHSYKPVASVMELSSQIFDGFVLQDLLGKKYFTIPYGQGSCANVPIPELNSYRVVSAKAEKNICVVLAEKKGKFDRVVFAFNDNFMSYTVRTTEDVQLSDINFTVLPNGVTVLANESDVEIFKDQTIKTVDNPPFDSTKKIYNVSGVIHYIDGKELYTVKMK